MTPFIILLISVIFGWIVSGSVVPAVTVVVSAVIFYTLVLLRFPLNRLLFAAGIMLAVTVQSIAFHNGYAGIIYEDLPRSFHFAMGCFLWAWMVTNIKDGSREHVGGWYFSVCLAGSVLLFWSATAVEIFQFHPFFVRILAATPLVLTLWQEYHRKEVALNHKNIISLLVLLPLAGALCSGSRATSAQLSKWLKQEEAYTYDLGEDNENSTRGGVGLSGGDGIVELPRKANIVVDKETRFYLKVNSIEDFLSLTRQPLYLRTSTVSIFESNEKILPVKTGRWILDGDDGTSDQITTLPERTPKRSLDYAVVLPKEDAKLIPLIEGTNRIHADEIFQFAEGRYQLGQESASEWVRFSAIGPRVERQEDIVPAKLEDPNNVYLSLPNTELARRVQKLTAPFIDAKSPADAISDYLQNRCRYSLKYRNPENLSPVENLLFGEKKGHCELFASATVMMLRSAGIPSRIAYGYTGGASNRDQLAIAFRGSDIHAWAEILNEKGEWRIFDTTPHNRGSSRLAQSRLTGKIDWKMAAFNPEAGMAVDDETDGQKSIIAELFATFSDWAASYFAFLITGLVLLFLIGRWLFGKNHSSETDHSNPTDDQRQIAAANYQRPEFVNAILSLGEKAGYPRPPGTTLREYVKNLNDQGIGYSDLSEAVDYFYEIRYGQGTSDPSIERQLLRSIRAIEKESR